MSKKYILIESKGAPLTISRSKTLGIAPYVGNQTLSGDIELIEPASWPAAWEELFPKINRPASKTAIVKAINSAVRDKKLFLFSNSAGKTESPSESGNRLIFGASGGGGDAGSPAPPLVASHTQSAEAKPAAISQVKPGSVANGAPSASIVKTRTEACPISMVSGEELLSLDDFILPGPLAFTWTRTYRSGHDRDLGLGHGWTHTACEHLFEGPLQVELNDHEGRMLSFKRPQLNQRSKLLNEQMALEAVSRDTYVLSQLGQPRKVFTRVGQGTHFRLTHIQQPSYKPETAETEAQGFALSLSYNAQNALTRIAGNWGKALLLTRDNHGHITRISLQDDASGESLAVAEYDYSYDNDLIAQRDSAGRGETYEYSNHLFSKRTLATGFSYYYEWDAEDTSARCIHTWGDKGIYDYRFSWDPTNNRSTSTDSRGFSKEFIYNEFGLLTQETDAEGGIHRYGYNKGLRTSYTDPEGNTTRYSYDAEQNLIGVIDALDQRQVSDYFQGKLISTTDKDGAHWQRSYNARGLLETLTAPDGQVTRYSYNAQGLVIRQEESRKRISRYEWNNSGELTALISPEGHRQALKYNSRGQLMRMDVWLASRQFGGSLRYFYNGSGELNRIIYPGGESVDITHNANGQIERISDKLGRVTHYQYDGLSQVISRTDAEGNSLAYEYDSERNLIRLSNENGDDYQFFYDGNERLIKEIGFDGRIQHYKYNKAGHLLKHLDAGEVITDFERDPLGRMLGKTSRALSDAEGKASETNRYLYDPLGRLKETYNSDQYLAFHYNHKGYLVKEHHSDLNENRQRISGSMVDIHYTRNDSGQLQKVLLPDHQIIAYDYDAADRLQQIQFNGAAITQIERDAFGFEINRHQGDLTLHSDYDPMGRLIKQEALNLQQKSGQQKTSAIHREYQYNTFGNLSSLKDGNWEVRYIYDMVDRLKRTEGDLTEEFIFDPASNLLAQSKKQHGKTTNGNRLAIQGDRKFEYDARGNLIRETRGKGGKLETVFTYNFSNQLIKVVKGSQTTEYSYDPIGRRIRKQDSFGATNYLWAADQLAQEQRNAIKKTYVYEPESFKPVAMVQDSEIYHYHLDHLGTPRELTNQQGAIVWKARYKTYGNLALKEVDEVENNLRFQGQYFDEETGLHYNRHRYYDPSVGQFTTQDPIGLLGGENNYQYAPNPVEWIDPFGLCKENGWNKFRKETKGFFANSTEAAAGYKKLKAGHSDAFLRTPTSGAIVPANAIVGTFLIGSYQTDLRYTLIELNYPKINDIISDFPVPEGQQFNLLNITDNLYSKYVADGGGFFTKVNGPWIDAAVKQEADIIVMTNVYAVNNLYTPATIDEEGALISPLTGFGKEIHRLEWKHDYRYDPNSKKMVKGDLASGLPTLTNREDYKH